MIFTLVSAAVVAVEPEATPTPSIADTTGEKRLGEYAHRMCLDRAALGEPGGVVVITNDTVGRIKGRGLLTSGRLAARSTASETAHRSSTKPQRDGKLRDHWRKLVDEEREKVARTQTELALLDVKIDSLEDAAFDSGPGAVRIWAKYEEARQRRRIIAHRLKRERAKLAEVVREARRYGAQPGWFR